MLSYDRKLFENNCLDIKMKGISLRRAKSPEEGIKIPDPILECPDQQVCLGNQIRDGSRQEKSELKDESQSIERGRTLPDA